jgi:hypothetical protein
MEKHPTPPKELRELREHAQAARERLASEVYYRTALAKLAIARVFFTEEQEFHPWLDFDERPFLGPGSGARSKKYQHYRVALMKTRNIVGEHEFDNKS